MAFFNYIESEKIELSFTEAVALALVVMAGIDGEVDDEEVKYLMSFEAISKDALDYAIEIHKQASVMECVELVAKIENIDGNTHTLIMSLMIEMAVQDDRFSKSEQLLLEVFIDILDVTKMEIAKMFEDTWVKIEN